MGNIHAVILAGGRGERFWPQSRHDRPKQLLALTGSSTMLQETLDRVAPLAKPAHRWIVTGADLEGPIRENGIGQARIIAEPAGRNTAPAIAVAAAEIVRGDQSAVMMVLPSDHYIGDSEMFRQTLRQGADLAGDGFLITIGLKPDRPETGYGYIERGEALPDCRIPCFRVKSFREKPDLNTAQRFFRSGYFYWNGGIFIWKASAILAEIQRHLPDLYRKLSQWQDKGGLAAGAEEFAEFYRSVDSISIDYGIMEKAEKVAVVKGDFGWDDLGSWEALERLHEKDESGNVVLGRAELAESRGNIVSCDRGLVAALGVSDLVIVKSGDAVMVCHRSRVQEVRKLLEQVKAKDDLKEYL